MCVNKRAFNPESALRFVRALQAKSSRAALTATNDQEIAYRFT
jgi:hypothetical protein